MIFPNKLLDGDVIGVTAVSMGCTDENDILRLENAYRKLEGVNFKYKETSNVRNTKKLVSSSKEDRAEQFMQLMDDDSVKAIIAVSGGEILLEILPYLDFKRINRPKWVQGYSDPSLLNFIITTKLDIATINAVNFKSFGMEPWHETISKNIEFLKNTSDLVQDSFSLYEGVRADTTNPYAGFMLNEEVRYKALYEGVKSVEGRVIGGCIDVLAKIIGTPFDNTLDFCNKYNEGMLWYIDNCELNIAEFYRTIWQIKQAGWFNNANGFLIGRIGVSKEMFDFNYLDSLHKCFDDMNVPVFYDVDIGHLPPQWIMINGSFGEFTFDDGKGKLIQKLI